MFDAPSMITEKANVDEVNEIEKNISIIMKDFDKTTKKVCDYIRDIGYEKNVDRDSLKIILGRMGQLLKSISKNILQSFSLVEEIYPGTMDELKKERLEFYRNLAFGISEVAYHGIVCINFVIPYIEDPVEQEKEKEAMADHVAKCIKVAAVHGIDIRKIIDRFIDLKSYSFMTFEDAARHVKNAKRVFEETGNRVVYEVSIEKIHSAKILYMIRVGVVEAKNHQAEESNEKIINMMIYNPHGYDEDLFGLIGNETIFLDLEEKVQKGFIPENISTNKVIH